MGRALPRAPIHLLFRMRPVRSLLTGGQGTSSAVMSAFSQMNPILCVCSGIRKCCKSPAREELDPLVKVGW